MLKKIVVWLILLSLAPAPTVAGFWSSFGGTSSSSEDGDASAKPDIHEELVSPIVNREIEASVVAHGWPFDVSNIYCEAWGHFRQDYTFLDKWVNILLSRGEMQPAATVQDATSLVLQATSNNNKALLEYALSLRAYSPLCELHRGLARQVVLQHASKLAEADAFAVTRRGDQQFIATTNEELNILLGSQDSLGDLESNPEQDLLPDEPLHKGGKAKHTFILYANMGSPSFVHLYQALVQSDVSFVVRHLGNVWYEEAGGNATVLQGYGVRLDIRNVEYRVFDDRSEGNFQEASLVNVSSLSDITNNTLAGVSPKMLKHVPNPIQLQQELWKLHETQQIHSQLVPPKWQRRQLALQAATVISQASDVLLTLQDVSQNLPSLASTLVHVPVSDKLQKLAELMEPLMQQTKGVALTINGRMIPVGRPSFNVFELLDILREEQQLLQEMQNKLAPYLSIKGLKQVQKAWAMGKAKFLGSSNDELEDDEEGGGGGNGAGLSGAARRVDVGRGWKRAVLYINDVEKDAQYSDWGRSLQQAVMAMQFGAPPSVRRNLFTMLVVIDPTTEGATDHAGFSLAGSLMQASYPVRIGYLIVNEKDMKECQRWISETGVADDIPCPYKPILEKGMTTIETLGRVDASTHAMHRLITQVVQDNVGQPVASLFVEYFLQTLENLSEGGFTMADLVTSYARVMSHLTGDDMKQAMDVAIKTLLEDEGEDSLSSYGKSLRFAISKAISPGMGFLNGRLLNGDSAAATQTFMDEQNHVFSLIMKGEITDRSPKSVYAKLLTGDGVFKRLHPLLSDTNDEVHHDLSRALSTESLLFPGSHTFKTQPEAIFTVEAVSDLETQEGLDFASKFVEIMDAYPDFFQDGETKLQTSTGYRMLPSPNSTSPALCAVLANAGMIGTEAIRAILENKDSLAKSIDELLALVPILSEEQKQLISSYSCPKWEMDDIPTGSFVVVNGKPFAPDGFVTKEDIEILMGLELSRSKATTRTLREDLIFEDKRYHDAVRKVSIFLAKEHSKEKQSSRIDMFNEAVEMEMAENIEKNPFRFSWNMDGQDGLMVQASVALDPATMAAQRVAPLLLVFRDTLKLPLQLVLVPKALVGDDKNVPFTSYYRFVAEPETLSGVLPPKAAFSNLPANHILTLRLDVPESWNIQQTLTVQDTDNLRCDVQSGCSDDAYTGNIDVSVPLHERRQLTTVEYGLKNLLIFGQCYDATKGSPPNGLQLTLAKHKRHALSGSSTSAEVAADGSVEPASIPDTGTLLYSDTLVMKNVGYWQLRANPGVWGLHIAPESRGAEIFDIVDGTVRRGKIRVSKKEVNSSTKTIVVKDFIGNMELLLVNRRPGWEKASLFYEDKSRVVASAEDDVINVFSLATGHLYERFLKIMMLSVTKRTSSKVKFWLFENFLSPSFKGSARAMADRIGCEVEFVTYKWPEWLRGQSEKQRIIWGYKILFLDVLFPLNVKKIIYVDADQVVRGDLKELWDMDLNGAPYGYTPFCTSRETTLGFQFWRGGFWESHLRGKPYHISALYVVDLEKFRKDLVGDNLRSIYQQLSADPNSLANLDQDLPNYAQHQVPIFSLPQEWLWCESWCSDESKADAKTIDLCNNPLHKEPKVSMAKRIISGALFKESWVELDAEVERYEKEYLDSLQ